MKRTTKIWPAVIVVTLALGALFIYARPNQSTTPAVSAGQPNNLLATDRPRHDFGTISMKDGRVQTVFAITNNQAEAMTLNQLYTSCMCTEATLQINGQSEGPFGMPGHGLAGAFNRILPPGGVAEIAVEFDPAAHGPAGIGQIERTVTLTGGGRELLTVAIRANVTP